MDNIKFCDRISNIRKSHMLSKEKASTMLNITSEQLEKIEDGRVLPNIEQLKKFIQVYNVDLETLIENTELDKTIDTAIQTKIKNKSKSVLVSGILSICTSWIIVGLVFGMYGLIVGLLKKDIKVNRIGKIGVILSLIGTIVSSILLSALIGAMI